MFNLTKRRPHPGHCVVGGGDWGVFRMMLPVLESLDSGSLPSISMVILCNRYIVAIITTTITTKKLTNSATKPPKCAIPNTVLKRRSSLELERTVMKAPILAVFVKDSSTKHRENPHFLDQNHGQFLDNNTTTGC